MRTQLKREVTMTAAMLIQAYQKRVIKYMQEEVVSNRAAKHEIAFEEVYEEKARRVARSNDLDRFEHTSVAELVHNSTVVEQVRRILVIWFDTSDEMRLRTVNGVHKTAQLSLKLRRH